MLCEAQEVASGELLRVPAGTLGRITIDGMIGTASFAGVQIVNVGQVGSTVDAIGFHFDVGGSVPVTYMFGQPTVGPLLPCRLHGHSDSAWMLHRDVIAAAVTKLATAESMILGGRRAELQHLHSASNANDHAGLEPPGVHE